MEAVRELERQFVIARGQVQHRFRIAFSEMPVRIVGWNDLTCRKEIVIDQDMVMPGAFNNLASRLDFHTLYPHDYLYGSLDLRAVFGLCKEHSTLRFLLSASNEH